MTKIIPSLDYIAALASQKISKVIGKSVKNNKKVGAKDLETLVTKALGVLQSQGIYAMTLFLLSRSGNKTNESDMGIEERIAVEIVSWLWPLRKPYEVIEKIKKDNKLETDQKTSQVNSSKAEILQEYANLTADLDTLLLVRDLYEQTLIYARFHAKAAKEEQSGSTEEAA